MKAYQGTTQSLTRGQIQYQRDPEAARERSRAWAQANPERVREAARAYREANRERLLIEKRAWYHANKERAKATNKAWREANPERALELVQKYRKENPERIRDTQRAWNLRNQALVKQYKVNHRAKRSAQGLNTMKGTPLKMVTGQMYLVRLRPDEAPKMGFTTNMALRLTQYKITTPHALEVIYQSHDIPGVNILERELKKKYAAKRIQGEFFDFNKTNIKNFKTLVNKVVSVDSQGNITYK